MKLLIRFIGALAALVALTVYSVESASASACPPQMQMAGVDGAVSLDAHGHSCTKGMNQASSDEKGPSEQSGSDAPDCPLGLMGASATCVAASLPATADQSMPSLPAGSLLSPSPDRARDLLLAAALFHPPRA